MAQDTIDEHELLADFAVSDWLKQAIETTRHRDILDALKDTEVLLQVLQQRWERTIQPSG